MDHRRVAIADAQPQDRALLRACLERLGQAVVVDAASADELVDACRASDPELIVADLGLMTRDGASAAMRAAAERRLPVVAVCSHADALGLGESLPAAVYACLVKPFREADVAVAIGIAARRHAEMTALRHDAANAQQLLLDRKLIERAKGLIMRQKRIDEPEAFLQLRLAARQRRQKMVDVARSILLAEGVITDEPPRLP
jgi:two-component system, response regulator PdtaR